MSLAMVSSLYSRVPDLVTIEGRHDCYVQEASVRLLLTSGGVTNTAIRDALVGLLGKPIAYSSALCIPTAMYGHPMAGPGANAWQFISGNSDNPMVDLGWKSVGVLELTALPSIDQERWVPLVHEADVLLVAGGDALYLCY
jgi:dipeptidase E